MRKQHNEYKLPKLLMKKNADAFVKRDKENTLTETDIDDYIELLQDFGNFLEIRRIRKQAESLINKE